MAGWSRNPFLSHQKGSLSTKILAVTCSSQASLHPFGTPIELSEIVPSQILADPTQTSPDIPPNATESPTDPSNPSHFKRLQTWWSHTISLKIEEGGIGGDLRDYLALERTFLAWSRTAISLISFGVVITQLFILKDVDPLQGKIIGAVICCEGIMVTLLGCIRYFRQQNLLMQGKALSAGWHPQVLFVMLLCMHMTLVVLVILDR